MGGEWQPAQLTGLHLDGRFDLTHPDGRSVRPALETGIRKHHLRMASTAVRSKFRGLQAKAKLQENVQRAEDDVKKQQAALDAMRLKVDAAKERSGKAKDKLRGLAGGMSTAGHALCGPPGRACKVPGMA